MTDPTTPTPAPTAVVTRYVGDDKPVTYTQVDDVDIDSDGLLAIVYNKTEATLSQVIYGPGQWASVDTTNVPIPKREPKRSGQR
jgi:hypothetical protein